MKYCAKPFKHYVNSEIRDSSLVRTAARHTCCSCTALMCKLICFFHQVSTCRIKFLPITHTACFIFIRSGVLVFQTLGLDVNFKNFSVCSQTRLQTTPQCYVRHKHSKHYLLGAVYWNNIKTLFPMTSFSLSFFQDVVSFCPSSHKRVKSIPLASPTK